MTNELSGRIKKGLGWVFLSQVVNQVILILFSIYLARVLDPNVFGLMGLVTVIVNYAAFFVDLGLGTALVQRKDLDQEHLSSIFWFNLAIGILFSGAFFLGSPWVAAFYGEPKLELMTRVVAVSFIVTSLSLVQSNLLDRNMDFRKKTTIGWAAALVGYTVGIWMALNQFGVWSLVAQLLVTQLVTTITLWVTSTWSPSFIFSWQKMKQLMPFGLNVLGDTSVNYWSRNADNLLIGKFVGSEGLGLYGRAYSLMLLPLRNISSVFSRVLFPAFSTIQEDLPRIRSLYLKSIRYISYITFPLMFGLVVVAREFVGVAFGSKWMGMVEILRWLAVLGAFQSIMTLNGVIYNSLGKAHIAFRVSVVVSIVLLVSFVAGLMINGLMGLTIAYFIAGTILTLPVYWVAIRQLSLSLLDVGKVLFAPFVGSVVLVLVVFVYKSQVIGNSDLVILVTSAALGAIVYVATLLLVDRTARTELAQLKLLTRIKP